VPRPLLDSGVAGDYAEILTQRARSLFLEQCGHRPTTGSVFFVTPAKAGVQGDRV